nr:hypothetical protein [uncultured Campylobacter sp.]
MQRSYLLITKTYSRLTKIIEYRIVLSFISSITRRHRLIIIYSK